MGPKNGPHTLSRLRHFGDSCGYFFDIVVWYGIVFMKEGPKVYNVLQLRIANEFAKYWNACVWLSKIAGVWKRETFITSTGVARLSDDEYADGDTEKYGSRVMRGLR